ncbi:MAG TPA: RagB/SusD family nutrient uptake outer membrane protein [Chitinophagaceae bacterium]|nr:RagB/SusD family nutrient uptake outer membrane protein [Chitinophagaceae bacterium]
MKNLLLTIAITSMMVLSSCDKDFINRAPESSVTINNLYKTDKDFLDAVIGTYSALRDSYSNMWQFGDIRGDDAYIFVSNQPSVRAVDVFSINSADELVFNSWTAFYVVINRANNVLSKIEDADPAIVKNKDRYVGEAKFLRALTYFNLVRIFGDVQLITKVPTATEALNTPRTPVATVYSEVIIKDLVDAVAKLPLVNTGTEVGRVTRGAAQALLGKVYLTIRDFPKAEATLQPLTTTPYSYALLPNYNDLFDYSKTEHHSEYVFDIEYQSNLNGLGSNYTNQFMPNVVQLLNYYQIIGTPGESMSPTQSFIDLWQPGDKRKDVTVQCCRSFTNPTTGQVVTFNPTTAPSYTKKYITPVTVNNDSKANWKVIRYADVLLMLAEALNENGKTNLAFAPLNQVRARAGLTPLAGLSQTQLRESIELERRFELAFEGHRWFDLVRTGKALATMAPTGMKDYMLVFPVPLSQIQVINNAAVFSQNPGYN